MVWPPHQASKDARTPKAEEITIIQSRIEYSPTMSKYNEFSKAIMKTPPTLDESTVIYIFYMTNVYTSGHGGGCVGCAPPPKNLKSPDTPTCRRQGGVHPGVKDPGEKFFMHTQVGPFLAIFWQNHPGVF